MPKAERKCVAKVNVFGYPLPSWADQGDVQGAFHTMPKEGDDKDCYTKQDRCKHHAPVWEDWEDDETQDERECLDNCAQNLEGIRADIADAARRIDVLVKSINERIARLKAES